MKDQSFEIKMWDLLNQVATDELVFEKKMTNLIPNLSKDGISGTIRLSSVDDESVLVEIEELKCELDEICDYCTATFKRQIEVHGYSARFTLNKAEKDYANDEVLFFIDDKKLTINVEEMLYQAVALENPFVLYCPKCAKQHENLDSISDEDFSNSDEFNDSKLQYWNITFHK